MINQTSYQILNGNPILWIMFIWRKLSEENQKYLIRAFQCMNFNKENHMVTYLRWNLKNKNSFLLPQDLLFYTSPVVQSDLRQKIYQAAQNGSTKIVEILAPLTDNPNSTDEDGQSPMFWAGTINMSGWAVERWDPLTAHIDVCSKQSLTWAVGKIPKNCGFVLPLILMIAFSKH